MDRRRKILAVCAIILSVLGGAFLFFWYVTLAWISATPISAERLAEVRMMAWIALVGLAACLLIGIGGIVSLFRR
jgi:hypothetical protein